jgi:hypothetical protein
MKKSLFPCSRRRRRLDARRLRPGGRPAAPATAPPGRRSASYGSSTVYPFTRRWPSICPVQPTSARRSNRPAPAAGLNLFCGGVGAAIPTSPRLASDQGERLQQCATNGVHQIFEVPIGIDGLALIDRRSIRPTSHSPRATFTWRWRPALRAAANRPHLARRQPGAAGGDPGLRAAADLRHPRQLRRA